MSGVSIYISRESTKRAKPMRGGKSTCCKLDCNELHEPSSGYCKAHRREYQKAWARNRTAELKRLRATQAIARRMEDSR